MPNGDIGQGSDIDWRRKRSFDHVPFDELGAVLSPVSSVVSHSISQTSSAVGRIFE